MSSCAVLALIAFSTTGQPRDYQGVQHDRWTKAYATPELYTWMLQQKLK